MVFAPSSRPLSVFADTWVSFAPPIHGGDAVRPSPDNFEWEATKKRRINQIHILDKGLEPLGNICKTRVLRFYLCTSAFLHTNFSISASHDASWISAEFYHFEPGVRYAIYSTQDSYSCIRSTATSSRLLCKLFSGWCSDPILEQCVRVVWHPVEA